MLARNAAVILNAADAVRLDRALREAIRLAYNSRRRPPPYALLAFADEVHQAAAEFRPDSALTSGSGTGKVPVISDSPASEPSDEAWLNTREAARLLGISDGMLRRMARQRALSVRATGHGYRFPSSEVAALAALRKERRHQAE